MKKLGFEVRRVTSGLAARDDSSRVARRAAEVQALWKDALQQLYKENAPYMLQHTNAVYIKKENGSKHLIVYMDDGAARSDIHCQQHFILTWLQEMHGEKVDVFKILPSRFDMRNRHPYETTEDKTAESPRKTTLRALSEKEKEEVERVSSTVENESVRRALRKAMSAEMAWKKPENK